MSGINIEEFISTIIQSDILDDNDKVQLIKVLVNSEQKGFISKGFYLKKNSLESVECYYRNIDESGIIYHGNTEWDDPNKVIAEFLRAKNLKNQNKGRQ